MERGIERERQRGRGGEGKGVVNERAGEGENGEVDRLGERAD